MEQGLGGYLRASIFQRRKGKYAVLDWENGNREAEEGFQNYLGIQCLHHNDYLIAFY